MNENIIIPIKIDAQPALQEARAFGVMVNNSFKSIRGYRDGKVELFLNVRAANNVAQLHSLGRGIDAASKSIDDFRKGSDAANYALVNLNRVVQDAPFGFMGIQNNINPLFESFQRLVAQTGSTRTALTALRTALIGPAGVGLAIAAVSSAISFATMGLDMWIRKKKESKAAADEAAKANETLAASLSQQLVTLTSLVGIIQSNTASVKDKDLAIKQINQDYKEYLDNIGKEGVTLQNVAQAYDHIIDRMLKQAVVKGLQEEIAKEVQKTATEILKVEKAEKARLAAEEKRRNALKNIPTEDELKYQAINKALENRNRIQRDGLIAQVQSNVELAKTVNETAGAEHVLSRLKNELKESLKPLMDLTDKYEDLGLNIKALKTANAEGQRTAKGLADAQMQLVKQLEYLDDAYNKGMLKPLDYVKERYDLLKKAHEDFIVRFNQPASSAIVRSIEEQLATASHLLKVSNLKLNTVAEITIKPKINEASVDDIKVDPKALEYIEDVKKKQQELLDIGVEHIWDEGGMTSVKNVKSIKYLDEYLQILRRQGQAFKAEVQSIAADSIGAFAQGIGDALVEGGGLAKAFSRVGVVLGRAMQDFGKQLIAGGVKILAAKAALKFALSNPYAMIAAGAALVATGAIITSALQRQSQRTLQGFAHGGAVSGPGLAIVGEHSSTSKHNPELWGRFDQFKELFGGLINEYAKKTQHMIPAYAPAMGAYPAEIRLVADGDSLVGVIERVSRRHARLY